MPWIRTTKGGRIFDNDNSINESIKFYGSFCFDGLAIFNLFSINCHEGPPPISIAATRGSYV
jgi:hypothetical protein